MEPLTALLGMGFPIVFFIAALLAGGIKVVNQYERGVVLTLGRFTGVRQPGLRYVVPVFQKMMKVDVRSMPIDVPKQEIITKDNVTVGVDAVVYLRVIDSAKAMLETTNYVYATSQFAQAALRDVTGNVDLDDLLAKREEISQQIKTAKRRHLAIPLACNSGSLRGCL